MLKEHAITRAKDMLISHIRGFLTNIDNYSDICDRDYTKCEIFDKEPNVLRTFPVILITAANGNYINSGLGDVGEEIVDENGIYVGVKYAGQLELPITIEAGTRSTKDRDILIDLLSAAIRIIFKRDLESNGIIIKDMRYGGESEILYDSDKLYIATLNLTVWMEWQYISRYKGPVKQINIGGRFNTSFNILK